MPMEAPGPLLIPGGLSTCAQQTATVDKITSKTTIDFIAPLLIDGCAASRLHSQPLMSIFPGMLTCGRAGPQTMPHRLPSDHRGYRLGIQFRGDEARLHVVSSHCIQRHTVRYRIRRNGSPP